MAWINQLLVLPLALSTPCGFISQHGQIIRLQESFKGKKNLLEAYITTYQNEQDGTQIYKKYPKLSIQPLKTSSVVFTN